MAKYIDVEKLIEECHPIIDVSTSIGNVGVTLEEIRAIPAADVRENARGEWIYAGVYDEYSDNVWKCSKCEHTWNFIGGYLSHPLDYDAHYCPNCGAVLRGAADE